MRWVMSGGTEPPIRGHWLEVWIGKTPRANPGHKGSIVAGMVVHGFRNAKNTPKKSIENFMRH